MTKFLLAFEDMLCYNIKRGIENEDPRGCVSLINKGLGEFSGSECQVQETDGKVTVQLIKSCVNPALLVYKEETHG